MYVIFGVLTTFVNMVVYFLLCNVMSYKVSNFIAICCAIIFAYITNKLWVFESKNKSFLANAKEFISFVGMRAVSSVLDMGLMIVLIDFVQTSNLFAKIFTAVLVVVLNYIFSKLIIFKR